MAGFAIFLPMPPYRHFTIMMATQQPMQSIQIGKSAGTFIARMVPVTRQDRSPVESGFFMILS